MTLTIHPITAPYEPHWRHLFTAYLNFYESEVEEKVYATTFARLLGDEPYDPCGFLAFEGGEPMGLVHYFFHRHCWKVENVCYLQDLIVLPYARGRGLGRALIEAVYKAADEAGCPDVYWTTQYFNERARKLYDDVGKHTPFIKYVR